jgi:hypothetical protein
MLYAYYPAGKVEWGDIVLKEIALPTKQRLRVPARAQGH